MWDEPGCTVGRRPRSQGSRSHQPVLHPACRLSRWRRLCGPAAGQGCSPACPPPPSVLYVTGTDPDQAPAPPSTRVASTLGLSVRHTEKTGAGGHGAHCESPRPSPGLSALLLPGGPRLGPAPVPASSSPSRRVPRIRCAPGSSRSRLLRLLPQAWGGPCFLAAARLGSPLPGQCPARGSWVRLRVPAPQGLSWRQK